MNDTISQQKKEKMIQLGRYVFTHIKKKSKRFIFDDYMLSFILYDAEKRHLCSYGLSMVPCNFHASDDFVPTCKYEELGVSFSQFIDEIPDTDWLSKSEMETIDWAVEQNIKKRFSVLMRSHQTPLVKKVRNNLKKYGDIPVISKIEMAKEAGADPDLIDYIKEQQEIDEFLNS